MYRILIVEDDEGIAEEQFRHRQNCGSCRHSVYRISEM